MAADAVGAQFIGNLIRIVDMAICDRDQLDLDREKKRQEALIEIRRRWGKNAIVMGMNLEDGATAVKRNSQIGGHRA